MLALQPQQQLVNIRSLLYRHRHSENLLAQPEASVLAASKLVRIFLTKMSHLFSFHCDFNFPAVVCLYIAYDILIVP